METHFGLKLHAAAERAGGGGIVLDPQPSTAQREPHVALQPVEGQAPASGVRAQTHLSKHSMHREYSARSTAACSCCRSAWRSSCMPSARMARAELRSDARVECTGAWRAPTRSRNALRCASSRRARTTTQAWAQLPAGRVRVLRPSSPELRAGSSEGQCKRGVGGRREVGRMEVGRMEGGKDGYLLHHLQAVDEIAPQLEPHEDRLRVAWQSHGHVCLPSAARGGTPCPSSGCAATAAAGPPRRAAAHAPQLRALVAQSRRQAPACKLRCRVEWGK